MSKLLYITAHPLTEETSKSLAAGKVFLDAYRSYHPEDEIVSIDLFSTDIPAIDALTFKAWGQLRKGMDFSALTDEEQQAVLRHNTLSDQFVGADKYVFVNPMWNHFVPPVLKSYLDVLCVAGKTFRYTAEGPVGLLSGKKALHIQSAGGKYDRDGGEVKDFGHAYLAHIMHFFGIHDLHTLFIEGADANPAEAEAIVGQAAKRAEALAASF